jgi:sugar-specific transcriptional regulator TrmB
MLQTIIAEFERVFSDVLGDFSKTAQESKVRADALSGEIDVALSTIRDTFKSEVVKELEKILTNMEDRVTESQKTIRDFWERAKSEVMYSLKEVWFVRSPEAVISSINDALQEAKMRVLIVAPTLDDVDIRHVLEAKSTINIRIACAIDLSSDKHLAILSVLDEHPNVTYRHYKGEVTLWGMNRDSEKCVVCVVSKNKEVAGIGTILQEDIRIFTPILEEAWMNSKKDIFEGIGKPKKVDRSSVDISFKPTHKTYYATPKTSKAKSEGPTVMRARTEVLETAGSAPAPAPRKVATPPAEIAHVAASNAGVSGLFTNPPADLKTLVMEGVKELEKLARELTGSSLGDNVEAFRQAIFNKMGFNSTLFELARAVRDLKAIPGPLSASQQQQYIDRFRMWASKLTHE